MAKAYEVQYYSRFAGRWMPYAAVTHNSQALQYSSKATAEEAVRTISKEYPRDNLRVKLVEAGKHVR